MCSLVRMASLSVGIFCHDVCKILFSMLTVLRFLFADTLKTCQGEQSIWLRQILHWWLHHILGLGILLVLWLSWGVYNWCRISRCICPNLWCAPKEVLLQGWLEMTMGCQCMVQSIRPSAAVHSVLSCILICVTHIVVLLQLVDYPLYLWPFHICIPGLSLHWL